MHTIGKYQLVAELARGGMGVVYLAVAHGVGRFHKLFVLKELKPELSANAEFVSMFLEEAQLAARLHHPNVVQTYDVDTEAGRPFLVMDYLDGRSLLQVQRRSEPRFTLAARVRVVVEVLQALEYVHELSDHDGKPLRLVHRDVTPHNVFITFDGQVKLLDFGIAKTTLSAETEAGVVKGKLTYVSPEQVQGRADARSDLFAVGILLWELATGQRLWGKRSEAEIIGALVQDRLPSLREQAPDIDPALLAVVEHALKIDPEQRYASARAMRVELEAWLGAQTGAPSVRQIGELVAELFAAERADRQRQIDQALRAQPTDDAPPSLRGMLPTISYDEATGGTPSQPQSLQTSTRAAASIDTPATPLPAPRSSRGLWAIGAVAVVILLLLARQLTTPSAPTAVTTATPVVAAAVAPVVAPVVTSAAASAVAPAASPETSAPVASAAPIESAAAARPQPGAYRFKPATPAPAATPDCSPPFYYQGTKKVFKAGCL